VVPFWTVKKRYYGQGPNLVRDSTSMFAQLILIVCGVLEETETFYKELELKQARTNFLEKFQTSKSLKKFGALIAPMTSMHVPGNLVFTDLEPWLMMIEKESTSDINSIKQKFEDKTK